MKLFFVELLFGEDEVVDFKIIVNVYTDINKAQLRASKPRPGNIIYGDWVVGRVKECSSIKDAGQYLRNRVVSWALCKQIYNLGFGSLVRKHMSNPNAICSKCP